MAFRGQVQALTPWRKGQHCGHEDEEAKTLIIIRYAMFVRGESKKIFVAQDGGCVAWSEWVHNLYLVVSSGSQLMNVNVESFLMC